METEDLLVLAAVMAAAAYMWSLQRSLHAVEKRLWAVYNIIIEMSVHDLGREWERLRGEGDERAAREVQDAIRERLEMADARIRGFGGGEDARDAD